MTFVACLTVGFTTLWTLLMLRWAVESQRVVPKPDHRLGRLLAVNHILN